MTEESSFIGEDLQVKENNEKSDEKTSKWKDAFIIETVNDNDNWLSLTDRINLKSACISMRWSSTCISFLQKTW